MIVVARRKRLETVGKTVDRGLVRRVVIIWEDNVEAAVELGGSKLAEVLVGKDQANEISLWNLYAMKDVSETLSFLLLFSAFLRLARGCSRRRNKRARGKARLGAYMTDDLLLELSWEISELKLARFRGRGFGALDSCRSGHIARVGCMRVGVLSFQTVVGKVDDGC